ncbi:hypothetical protein FACS1894162_4340 [Bacteroidia bacterium]|nr:hypothetical protein FACS1894162_4340 [Bacteroidia bacterium]
MKKKILTTVFCLALALNLAAQTSGTYGDNLSWKITGAKDNYTLTISGAGAMPDYSYDAPWSAYSGQSFTNDMGDVGYQPSNIKLLVIGNSVTSIGAGAFSRFDALTSVTIPSSVKAIGKDAFSQCRSLTSITVDAANPSYSSQDGILFNKNKTTLIQYPFQKKGAYIIPSNVTTIGDGAFDGSDDWGNGNDNLTSITIPNSVTSIGAQAFASCSGLQSVTIPGSVTSIGNAAFYGCYNLVSFISKAVTPPALEYDIIDNTKISVYVPASSVQAYRKANYWSKYNIVPDTGTPNTKTTDSGVVINGVKWATRNVDEKGKFVNNPEDNGYHYTWKEAQTACPVGWRVPTLAELRTLLNINKVRSEWTTQNGYKGRKFTDKTTGKNLFLPAAGFSDGNHVYYVATGFYWSSTLNSLGCGSSAPVIHSSNNLPGKNLSVRCVAK